MRDASYCPITPEPEALTLKCINVRWVGRGNFMNATTWDFQIEGRGDTWYQTHYAWALVKDTEDNRRFHQAFEEWHREKDRCQRMASAVFKRITTVKHQEGK